MAVVEVGWTVRAGYIGDVRCTRQLPSLVCDDAPDAVCLPALLSAAEASGTAAVSRLWADAPDGAAMDRHVRHLARLVGSELRGAAADPLVLLAPEAWHRQPAALRALFAGVLEGGVAAALQCVRPSVAWTLSAGRTSAVVLDAGHTRTTAAAVLDGYALRGAFAESAAAGDAVTEELLGRVGAEAFGEMRSVARFRSPGARGLALRGAADDVKRMACFVRPKPPDAASGAMAAGESLALRTPDGFALHVSHETRVEPYEVLFSAPRVAGGTAADLLAQCRRAIDPEWQQQAVTHLLCGGTAQVPGYRERLIKETQRRDSVYFRYEAEGVFHVLNAVDGAWAGASLAADSSFFTPLWVTRAEMEEEGDSVLVRKFFL